MMVEHFGGQAAANASSDLDLLDLRYGPSRANEFHLSHEARFPMLAILVRDRLANLHYFPDATHAGFVSIGEEDKPGSVVFFTNTPTEEIEVSASSVVPFELAREAATQFMSSPMLPPCVRWTEL